MLPASDSTKSRGKGDDELDRKLVIPMLFAIVFSIPAQADESPAAMGIRKLGMGGASVAAVNDEDLLFSNPARLSWVQYSVFSVFDLRLGLNYDSLVFLERLNRYYEGHLNELTETQITNLEELKPLYKLNGPLNIIYLRPYLGFGVFETCDIMITPEYHNESRRSSVRVSAQQTVSGMLSFAYDREIPPQPSRVSIGATIKYLGKAKMDRQDTGDISDHGIIAEIGRGFGLDIGTLYKIRDTYTIGLMVRNALSSQFLWDARYKNRTVVKKSKPSERSELDSHITMGVSFTPAWQLPHILRDVVLAFDLDGMRDPRIGVEVNIYRILRLRYGVSKESFAFGTGLSLGIFAFDYAFVHRVKDTYVGDLGDSGHFVGIAYRL